MQKKRPPDQGPGLSKVELNNRPVGEDPAQPCGHIREGGGGEKSVWDLVSKKKKAPQMRLPKTREGTKQEDYSLFPMKGTTKKKGCEQLGKKPHWAARVESS